MKTHNFEIASEKMEEAADWAQAAAQEGPMHEAYTSIIKAQAESSDASGVADLDERIQLLQLALGNISIAEKEFNKLEAASANNFSEAFSALNALVFELEGTPDAEVIIKGFGAAQKAILNLPEIFSDTGIYFLSMAKMRPFAILDMLSAAFKDDISQDKMLEACDEALRLLKNLSGEADAHFRNSANFIGKTENACREAIIWLLGAKEERESIAA